MITRVYKAKRINGQYMEERDVVILVERHLAIHINGSFYANLTCTDIDVEALIIGFLKTQGIIYDIKDIKSLMLHDNETYVKVSRSTFNASPNNINAKKSPQQIFPISDIFKQIALFYEEAFMHKKTGAVHRCVLCNENGMIFSADDLSRHNTVDKVIGMALRDEIDLKGSYLIFTGRVPEDVVLKLINAEVPVFIARSYPTINAINLAEENNITLIGNAQNNSLQIYTGDWRIYLDNEMEFASNLV